MPKCFQCKAEVGGGGVLQEDGRLLCVKCDGFEYANPPLAEAVIQGSSQEPTLDNLAALVNWILSKDEKARRRVEDLRAIVKDDPLPGLKTEILGNLKDNPDLPSLRAFIGKINEIYPVVFEQAQLRRNAGAPIGDETDEVWWRIIMMEPWLAIKLNVISYIVMKMSMENKPLNQRPSEAIASDPMIAFLENLPDSCKPERLDLTTKIALTTLARNAKDNIKSQISQGYSDWPRDCFAMALVGYVAGRMLLGTYYSSIHYTEDSDELQAQENAKRLFEMIQTKNYATQIKEISGYADLENSLLSKAETYYIRLVALIFPSASNEELVAQVVGTIYGGLQIAVAEHELLSGRRKPEIYGDSVSEKDTKVEIIRVDAARFSKFKPRDPRDEGWFANNTPVDHLSRCARHCPSCQRETVQDLFKSIVGAFVGLGLPFGRKSTIGKVGSIGKWYACAECGMLEPVDAPAIEWLRKNVGAIPYLSHA